MSAKQYNGMNFQIRYIPYDRNEWDLRREIANVLHSEEFNPEVVLNRERLLNFQVKLNMSEITHTRNLGTAVLTLPTQEWGNRFFRYIRANPIYMESSLDDRMHKLYFTPSGKPHEALAMRLDKTKYTSPDLEEQRQEIMRLLDGEFRVDLVQFGTYYRSAYTNPPSPRAYSIEWMKDYTTKGAWLTFEYDLKLIRIKLGDNMTETEGYTIAISLTSISRIGVGNDPLPYICFDTQTPPVLEKVQFYPADSEGKHSKRKRRVGSLPDGHDRVAPFAQQLRVVLRHDDGIIKKFAEKCKIFGFPDSVIANCNLAGHQIDASRQQFFSMSTLHRLEERLKKFDWHVAFQISSLLHNCILTTGEIFVILPRVDTLKRSHSSEAIADLMKHYTERLRRADRPPSQSPLECLNKLLNEKNVRHLSLSGHFECCHVTVTPTRLILEGPYPTQSNRVIRQYTGFNHNFIRVEFRDENRLRFRWAQDVDASSFLQERVGGILKNGFSIAGRRFEFLAYSNSALREHSVWFMSPFRHPTKGWVNSASIRSSLGSFEEDAKLMRQPSKYAARLAQAFTATDPSVSIHRREWEVIDDLLPALQNGVGENDYLFTDGVGTISERLAQRIWEALLQQRPRHSSSYVVPSAYQIRFLGFKGMVGIDKELDRDPSGIQMRLRKSMKKFESADSEMAEIEIARSFERPNDAYLYRAIVMLLEDRKVRLDTFLELQRSAVAKALTLRDSLGHLSKTLRGPYFGSFHLPRILERLEQRGFVLRPDGRNSPSIEGPFLKQVCEVVMVDMVRSIKHDARVKVPDSYKLVGLADEGVAYRDKPGYENVYTLEEGFIYACVQKPGEDPVWLEGSCMISRSPVCHPGDVQRVYAIGKPPPNRKCLFAHLKNVVVLPSVGSRSLASCLGGGDLDGDDYDLLMCPELLTPECDRPAEYKAGKPLELDRKSTISDVCDFIVEYIDSDVLGLLSVNWLIRADQSKEGVRDEECLKLAELCSQAVDFPKQGVPVDLQQNPLPKRLIRPNPDWHSTEIVSLPDKDYYESDRALGHMYRDIELTDPERKDEVLGWPDSVVSAIACLVPKAIKNSEIGPTASEMEQAFIQYTNELRYIAITHTLSDAPGVTLRETEIVAGTILGRSTEKRFRSGQIYKLKLHTGTLVRSIREVLGMEHGFRDAEHCQLVFGKAWAAWNYGIENQRQFGGQSFALIALGVLLDCSDYQRGARLVDNEGVEEEGDRDRWGYDIDDTM